MTGPITKSKDIVFDYVKAHPEKTDNVVFDNVTVYDEES